MLKTVMSIVIMGILLVIMYLANYFVETGDWRAFICAIIVATASFLLGWWIAIYKESRDV